MQLLKRIETEKRAEFLKGLNDRAQAISQLREKIAVRKAWLNSEQGKAWRAQRTWPLHKLRIEERKARRDMLQAERGRDRAIRLAELAYQLKRLQPNSALVMDGTERPANRSQAFRQMDVRMEEYVRDLPSEIQQRLEKVMRPDRTQAHSHSW